MWVSKGGERIRTEAALYVAGGQLCGCHEGAVLDAHAVEAGVLVRNAAQDLDRVLHARLLHLHLHPTRHFSFQQGHPGDFFQGVESWPLQRAGAC